MNKMQRDEENVKRKVCLMSQNVWGVERLGNDIIMRIFEVRTISVSGSYIYLQVLVCERYKDRLVRNLVSIKNLVVYKNEGRVDNRGQGVIV